MKKVIVVLLSLFVLTGCYLNDFNYLPKVETIEDYRNYANERMIESESFSFQVVVDDELYRESTLDKDGIFYYLDETSSDVRFIVDGKYKTYSNNPIVENEVIIGLTSSFKDSTDEEKKMLDDLEVELNDKTTFKSALKIFEEVLGYPFGDSEFEREEGLIESGQEVVNFKSEVNGIHTVLGEEKYIHNVSYTASSDGHSYLIVIRTSDKGESDESTGYIEVSLVLGPDELIDIPVDGEEIMLPTQPGVE